MLLESDDCSERRFIIQKVWGLDCEAISGYPVVVGGHLMDPKLNK
jgi:hypothetical protein